MQNVEHVKKTMKNVLIAERIIQNATNVKNIADVMKVDVLVVTNIVKKDKKYSTEQ